MAPSPTRFSLFASCPPGLEPHLLKEVHERGWTGAKAQPGGVTFTGASHDIWRANLLLRGASRVLVRLGAFRAESLNVLHGKAFDLPWAEFLTPGTTFTVEATCRKSKIYHSTAAAQRVTKAAASATGAEAADSGTRIFVRIENNEVTVSADSSGDLLYKRGFKEAVVKAPLRETMASLFLRACSYTGGEPLLDPMCGSGTIVLEAADIAAGLAPGRARSFAFENFASFKPVAYDRVREKALGHRHETDAQVFGSDRAAAAVEASTANAERAGTGDVSSFVQTKLSEVEPPTSTPGLVLTNPPYGARISNRGELVDLYRAFGQVMRDRFQDWRIGLVTSEEGLAKATGLHLKPGPPIPHGPLKVRLWQS